jgi:acetolactate synthase-1/2/3 large subunit
MRAAFGDDVYLIEDSATLGAWVERCFDFRTPGTHIRDIGGTMGFGVAAAAGIKLALPDREVVCFTGDGAFMMVDSAIHTMALHRLGVLTLVWNNQAYLQTGFRYPRVPGNALHNPDFAELSRTLGALAERVEAPADLGPALRQGIAATKTGQPVVIEVVTTSDPRYATPGSYYGRTPAYKSGTPPSAEAYYSTPIRS